MGRSRRKHRAEILTESQALLSPIWAGFGGLFLLVCVAYAPVTQCGFIWDDDQYVTENTALHDVSGLASFWYDIFETPQFYPLVFTSFWIEHHLWGNEPLGYHISNVLLHAGNCVLLWLILQRLKVPNSWFVAALFAVHPVCVESVAWITERKNVLSGFFYLTAALSYPGLFGINENHTSDMAKEFRRSHWWRSYAVSTTCFVCALLSKTVTATLPAAILVITWWKTGRMPRKDHLPLLPWFALGFSFGLLTAWLERHHVGASTSDLMWSWSERFQVAGRVPWFYLGKIVWPLNTMFIYPPWALDSTRLPLWIGSIAIAVTLVGLTWNQSRWGRGPLAAILLFGGTLVPVLGLIPVYPMRFSIVADHFQYLAMLGPLALIVAGVSTVLQKAHVPAWTPNAIGSGVLFFLTALTWLQLQDYRDAATLWARTLEKNPQCALCLANQGSELVYEHRSVEAEPVLRHAVGLAPSLETAWFSLAEALHQQGRNEEAAECCRTAIACFPTYSQAYLLLSHCLEDMGQSHAALDNARMAVALMPTAERLENYGRLLAAKGDLKKASEQLQAALTLEPLHTGALLNLGSVAAQQQDWALASQSFKRVLQSQSDSLEARGGLARVAFSTGAYSEALSQFSELVNANPGDVYARGQIALILAAAPVKDLHHPDTALAHAAALCKATNNQVPELLDIHGIAHAAVGNFTQATQLTQLAYQRVVESNNTTVALQLKQRLELYERRERYWLP